MQKVKAACILRRKEYCVIRFLYVFTKISTIRNPRNKYNCAKLKSKLYLNFSTKHRHPISLPSVAAWTATSAFCSKSGENVFDKSKNYFFEQHLLD